MPIIFPAIVFSLFMVDEIQIYYRTVRYNHYYIILDAGLSVCWLTVDRPALNYLFDNDLRYFAIK